MSLLQYCKKFSLAHTRVLFVPEPAHGISQKVTLIVFVKLFLVKHYKTLAELYCSDFVITRGRLQTEWSESQQERLRFPDFQCGSRWKKNNLGYYNSHNAAQLRTSWDNYCMIRIIVLNFRKLPPEPKMTLYSCFCRNSSWFHV